MKLHQILRTLSEYRSLFRKLADDVNSIVKPTSPEHAERDRRFIIRAMFALIESDLNFRKHCALGLHQIQKASFSQAEIVCLTEEQYHVSDQGVAKTRDCFPALIPNIKFAHTAFAKAMRIEDALECSGREWEALRKTVAVRHRLAHPKVLQDVIVTDEELENALLGYEWYCDIMVGTSNKAVESLKKLSEDEEYDGNNSE